ncbi:hypothetical protein [Amaricoccus macauensis]|uniref:hypothetical protein n=1 Tax=Amaricoccus macauensis TaxID=57001 RepID=UPI003C7B48B3
MSDSDTSMQLVSVTLSLPSGLLAAYDALVDQQIYPDRASALLYGLVRSWYFDQGTFHSIRLDIKSKDDQTEDPAFEKADAEEDPENSAS